MINWCGEIFRALCRAGQRCCTRTVLLVDNRQAPDAKLHFALEQRVVPTTMPRRPGGNHSCKNCFCRTLALEFAKASQANGIPRDEPGPLKFSVVLLPARFPVGAINGTASQLPVPARRPSALPTVLLRRHRPATKAQHRLRCCRSSDFDTDGALAARPSAGKGKRCRNCAVSSLAGVMAGAWCAAETVAQGQHGQLNWSRQAPQRRAECWPMTALFRPANPPRRRANAGCDPPSWSPLVPCDPRQQVNQLWPLPSHASAASRQHAGAVAKSLRTRVNGRQRLGDPANGSLLSSSGASGCILQP